MPFENFPFAHHPFPTQIPRGTIVNLMALAPGTRVGPYEITTPFSKRRFVCRRKAACLDEPSVSLTMSGAVGAQYDLAPDGKRIAVATFAGGSSQ